MVLSGILIAAAVLAGAPKPPPRAPAARESALLLSTSALERVVVGATGLTVRVDPWRREVRVSGPQGAAALERLVPAVSTCPRREQRDGLLVLGCRTGRLAVDTRVGKALTLLDFRELRGLPREDPRVSGLAWSYPPHQFGLGAPCPGNSREGTSECLLLAGRRREVEVKLRSILADNSNAYAALRLGDLLAERAPLEAQAFYLAAGRRDTFGRIARVRVCELTGCPPDTYAKTYDATGLAEPARTEFELRYARMLALSGRPGDAARSLLTRINANRRDPACAAWPQVCAGVAAAALEDGDREVQVLGLQLFLLLQKELGPTRDVQLARRAAEVAQFLGAPGFAANVLASVSGVVRPSGLAAHFARIVALYGEAGDEVRSRLVREYAQATLGIKLQRQEAETAEQALEGDQLTRMRQLVDDAQHQLDLSETFTSIGRARALQVTAP